MHAWEVTRTTFLLQVTAGMGCRCGETTVVANAAVDAWSLGVLAVELFTNDVALDLMQGKEKVRLIL